MRDRVRVVPSARWGRGGDLRRAALQILVPHLWLGAFALAAYATWAYTAGPSHLGFDAHAYWLAGRQSHPYGLAPGDGDAVLYSPAFIQVMRVLAVVPWPGFLALCMLANACAFWWLSAPLSWRWRVPLLVACWPAVLLANINPLLCVCAVLAVTRPGTWAVVPAALTKITPSFVSIAWWLGTGEWRRVLHAASLTCLLVVASYAWQPGLWSEWVHFLLLHSDDSLLRTARLGAGLLVSVLAARSRRPWLTGVAFLLLLPMGGWYLLDLALILPRLLRHDVATASVRLVTTRPAWASRRRIGTVIAAPARAITVMPSQAGTLPRSSSQA
jgi:hypothetical protein